VLVLPIHHHGELFAMDDDAAPGELCVALARPRLSRDRQGAPRLSLVRWTPEAGAAAGASGARLSLDIEVSPAAADLAAAGLAARTTRPFPWLDAVVRLDGPLFDPVDAEVSIAAGGTAAVSADLSAAAAAVLAPLLTGDSVSPLQVTWIGHVRVRLPPVEVMATADITEVRRRIDIISGNRRTTTTRSVIDANAHIEIHGTDNAALEQALREWVLDELTDRFARGDALSVRAAGSDVVRWPIQLATTLDDLLPAGMATPRRSLVETVVLGPTGPGRVPPVAVRALGDFAGVLERVDVKLQSTAPSAPDPIEVSLTSDAPTDVRLGARDFRWSRRIKIKDRAVTEWSPWEKVKGSTGLNVPVPLPEALNIEVLAAGVDFTRRWSSIRVVLEHTAAGSEPASATIELSATRPSQTWTTPLAGARGTLTARLTYLSQNGQVVERMIDQITGGQVIVEDPLDSAQVRVALLPAGTGWSSVACVMVDLRYIDGSHIIDETVSLRTIDDFLEWEAPARPDGPRTIQWRAHASFSDGRFESRPWQTSDAGVIVVRIDGVARREVQVLPIFFDPAQVKEATVRLRGAAQTETVVLRDRSPRTAVLDAGPFTWTVQWTMTDGRTVAETAPAEGDDVIVLPRVPAG
jgi:hypothetical protein